MDVQFDFKVPEGVSGPGVGFLFSRHLLVRFSAPVNIY